MSLTIELWRKICHSLEKRDLIQTRLLCRNSEVAASEFLFCGVFCSAVSIFIHHRNERIDIYIDFPQKYNLEQLKTICEPLQKLILWNVNTKSTNEYSIFDLTDISHKLNGVLKHPKIQSIDLENKRLDFQNHFPNLKHVESNSSDFSMFCSSRDPNLKYFGTTSFIFPSFSLTRVDKNSSLPQLDNLQRLKLTFTEPNLKFSLRKFLNLKHLHLVNSTFSKSTFDYFCQCLPRSIETIVINSDQNSDEYCNSDYIRSVMMKRRNLRYINFL